MHPVKFFINFTTTPLYGKHGKNLKFSLNFEKLIFLLTYIKVMFFNVFKPLEAEVGYTRLNMHPVKFNINFTETPIKAVKI
jgi:hypothetical protein